MALSQKICKVLLCGFVQLCGHIPYLFKNQHWPCTYHSNSGCDLHHCPECYLFLVFRKTEEYNQALHLADNMTKGKMNRVLVKLGMN